MTTERYTGFGRKELAMRYYTFLFKRIGEAWSISAKILGRNEDDAYEQAMKYAERNGYSDFILT